MNTPTTKPLRIDLSEVMVPPPDQVSAALRTFRTLLLTFRQHSPDHPSCGAAVTAWLQVLDGFHRIDKPLVLQSTGSYLEVNGCVPTQPGDAMDNGVLTAHFLRTRGIHSLAMLPGITGTDIARFMVLLYELPEGVTAAIDLRPLLQERQVTRLEANFLITRNILGPGDDVVSSRLEVFHGQPDPVTTSTIEGEAVEIDFGNAPPEEIDLTTLDLRAFDFDAVDVTRLDFGGLKADQLPLDRIPLWRLRGAQLDDIGFDFTTIEDGEHLARWDPANLFASRRFVEYSAGAGYRRFDTFVRSYLEAALEDLQGAERRTALRERLCSFSVAVSVLREPQERLIFSQRLAALVLELSPELITRLLTFPQAEGKLLREQVLKGLIHAHQLASRVVQEMAFRCSKTDDPDLFMMIAEALESLIPGRVADGDLEPALAALTMVNHLRTSTATPLIIRTRATQLLRWLCRPELVDRLLLGCIDDDDEVTRRSRQILLNLGPSAGDLLLAELKRSQNPRVRLVIVDIVAALLSQEHAVSGGTFNRSFRTLLLEIEHAEDHPWYYVRNLLLVMRKIGDDRFLDWIARFIEGTDARVRQEAIVACAAIDTPAARRVLRSVADGVEIDTPDSLSAVVHSLSSDRDFDVLAFLMRVVDESQVLAVRRAAVQRLCALSGRGVIDALDQLLNRKRGIIGRKPYYPDELRALAVAELRTRDDPAAERALDDLPLDPSERVRRAGRDQAAPGEAETAGEAGDGRATRGDTSSVPPWEP